MLRVTSSWQAIYQQKCIYGKIVVFAVSVKHIGERKHSWRVT